MRNFDDYRETLIALTPNSIGKTVFNITDNGVHKSDETYSSININIAIEWGQSDFKQYLVCDKIELYYDADIIPPNQPTGLKVLSVSDSKVKLSWEVPSDNTGVVEYLIYNGNRVEGYSRENIYEIVFLGAETEYEFSVTALDRNRNESLKSESMIVTTERFRQWIIIHAWQIDNVVNVSL